MYKLIRTLLPVLAAMIATTVSAQSVSWKSSVQHLDGQTYRIVLEASIPAPWHMYDMGPYEGGPNATTITFTPGEGAVLEGGVEQLTRPERHYDKTFGMEIGTFARKAQFAQSVKLTAPQATVKAELAWMICNDTSCLPPDDTELTITLPAGATPAVQPAETPAKESAAAPETVPAAEIAPAQKDAAGGGSLWGLIIEAILWGFAALLTPCVFPMVPMTVSFFMKGSGSPALGRIRAGMYGFFIVALYTLPIAAIILITRLVGGDAVTADIFNWLATHWLPNILFFLVFMVFAASFFGAFEITMPSWMVNKTDSKADSKGLAGIFFMALTLVLVSFSCTGPIVGSVLIKSTAGGVLESDRDDAGLLRRLRAAVHPLRLLPLDAQEAAQERRMAQFGESRAGIHRSRAGHEVPLGGRPDLPLGTARPGDLPRRVDRDLSRCWVSTCWAKSSSPTTATCPTSA